MVKKSKIAQHSKTSFIEKEAIHILSSFIEEKRMAITFFSENDKTPNHDGFFEILNNNIIDNCPKKQFIVQIKGTENLKYISTGVNKGKYKYVLNTKFLNYIKEKVAESPAIYFVVDVKSNKIFWIYLSDSKLMSLNFEGKTKITYYFSPEEICNNIDDFLKELNIIADKRNQKFLNKSPEEIAKIQEAVEHLNDLFNNDLKFIKDLMFPDLWRFGIAHSKIPQESFTITIGNNIITNIENGNSFSIYPQVKGVPDTGIRENSNLLNDINLFNSIDLIGNSTPKTYVNSVISQILKQFFDSPLIISLAPDVIISEILFDIIFEFENIFNIKIKNTISDVEKTIYLVIKYIIQILKEENLCNNEKALKTRLILIFNQKNIKVNLLSLLNECNCNDLFLKFYENNIDKEIIIDKPDINIQKFIEQYFTEYILSIKRAKELGLTVINFIKIDTLNFFLDDKNDKYEIVKSICKIWFNNLEKVYLQIYNEIFRDNKYLNIGLYKYQIMQPVISNLLWVVVKYPDKSFSIVESTIPLNPLNDKDVISSQRSLGLSNFICNKRILYNSMKCLLYQGITKALQLDCEGVAFGCFNNYLFDI